MIEWSGGGAINDVSIEYSDNNGASWNTVVASTANDGAYQWDPVADANSNQCLVRISDVANPSINDTSDSLFVIYRCNSSIAGDLNSDCYVNMLDFAVFAGHWLECANAFDERCN